MAAAAILKNELYHNNRIYWPIACKFCQWNSIYFSSVSLGLKMRLVKVQDGSGCHLEKQKCIIATVFIGRSCANSFQLDCIHSGKAV